MEGEMNSDRLGLALLPFSSDLLHPMHGTRSVVRSYLYRKAYPCYHYEEAQWRWTLIALDRGYVDWRMRQGQN